MRVARDIRKRLLNKYASDLLSKPKKKTTKRKVAPKNKVATKKTDKTTKKSIISALLPRKTPRMFIIYTVHAGEVYFIRLIAQQNDEFKISYDIKFVTRLEDCSKFVSIESARNMIETIRTSHKIHTDLKAIEYGKEIQV